MNHCKFGICFGIYILTDLTYCTHMKTFIVRKENNKIVYLTILVNVFGKLLIVIFDTRVSYALKLSDIVEYNTIHRVN